ncbi:hypothetical protein GCM10010275_56490 [Streptomyces litmocidini]|uniref:hypothetical protein n=1 Tax=Streptomyces litmocidini TaxID=67318 RepID=UPI00167DA1DB|nr:hypothetical protein [Streptomyces litmocidini]GGV08715.1 hypothetical protein GCM10010275_56490 [Streptomyces litmocidini]
MTSQPAAALRTRLVDQAASDLKENRRRQQELAEKLRMLKQEEALLVDILELAERYESLAESSSPREQDREDPTPPGTAPPKTSASPSTGTPAQRAARTGKSARTATRRTEKSVRTAAKGKSRQPLLGDLLLSLLADGDEPRPAKELRDELLERHPDRDPTPQVVRNTLESLVAKGHVRRHKQQRSVKYALEESGRHALAAQ